MLAGDDFRSVGDAHSVGATADRDSDITLCGVEREADVIDCCAGDGGAAGSAEDGVEHAIDCGDVVFLAPDQRVAGLDVVFLAPEGKAMP